MEVTAGKVTAVNPSINPSTGGLEVVGRGISYGGGRSRISAQGGGRLFSGFGLGVGQKVQDSECSVNGDLTVVPSSSKKSQRTIVKERLKSMAINSIRTITNTLQTTTKKTSSSLLNNYHLFQTCSKAITPTGNTPSLGLISSVPFYTVTTGNGSPFMTYPKENSLGGNDGSGIDGGEGGDPTSPSTATALYFLNHEDAESLNSDFLQLSGMEDMKSMILVVGGERAFRHATARVLPTGNILDNGRVVETMRYRIVPSRVDVAHGKRIFRRMEKEEGRVSGFLKGKSVGEIVGIGFSYLHDPSYIRKRLGFKPNRKRTIADSSKRKKVIVPRKETKEVVESGVPGFGPRKIPAPQAISTTTKSENLLLKPQPPTIPLFTIPGLAIPKFFGLTTKQPLFFSLEDLHEFVLSVEEKELLKNKAEALKEGKRIAKLEKLAIGNGSKFATTSPAIRATKSFWFARKTKATPSGKQLVATSSPIVATKTAWFARKSKNNNTTTKATQPSINNKVSATKTSRWARKPKAVSAASIKTANTSPISKSSWWARKSTSTTKTRKTRPPPILIKKKQQLEVPSMKQVEVYDLLDILPSFDKSLASGNRKAYNSFKNLVLIPDRRGLKELKGKKGGTARLFSKLK